MDALDVVAAIDVTDAIDVAAALDAPPTVAAQPINALRSRSGGSRALGALTNRRRGGGNRAGAVTNRSRAYPRCPGGGAVGTTRRWRGAAAAPPNPLEAKREVCELSPDCDELADQVGFQEAYRRFYGPV
uniref:Osteocalcin n=1 Tax=Coturnix japonica TaxID=93934 RepID=A0A8C2TTU3_COTJA